MRERMSHRERVRAALDGEPVDRPPVSMWRHFFAEERTPEGLAEAMLAFQRRFDWDFMKVNPRASYHAEDWGLEVKYAGGRAPEVVGTPVVEPYDWLRLDVLDPTRGVLGQHLTTLEAIASGLDGQVPFLMTVFTPLSIASSLVPSEEVFLRHLHEHQDKVAHALAVVTETFIAFSKACLDRGASGLFYATTSWATSGRMSEEEYRRFARPSDLELLESLPGAEFHMLHVCREDNFLSAVSDYPVHAFNWDARGEGNSSLSEGRSALGGKAVVGGLDHKRGLVEASPEEITAEIGGTRAAMGAQGWMLAPGCTFAPETQESNIEAVRNAAAAG